MTMAERAVSKVHLVMKYLEPPHTDTFHEVA